MADPDFDPDASIRDDVCRHWTYRWLAARGPNAVVNDAMANEMRAGGVSEADIYTVAIRLQQLRRARMVPVPPGKLEALLASAGADPSTVNIHLAQRTYFRAMSEAAALSARAQREGRFNDGINTELVMQALRGKRPHRVCCRLPYLLSKSRSKQSIPHVHR